MIATDTIAPSSMLITSELDAAEQQLQQLRHSYLPGAFSQQTPIKTSSQPVIESERRLSSDFEVVDDEAQPTIPGTHEHAISHLLRRRSAEGVEGFVELVHQADNRAIEEPAPLMGDRQRLGLKNESTGRRILVPVFVCNTFDYGKFFGKLADVVIKTSDDLVDVLVLDGVPELHGDVVILPTDKAIPQSILPVCGEAFRWFPCLKGSTSPSCVVEILVSPAAPSLPAELQRRDEFQSDLCVIPADLTPNVSLLASWQDAINASAIPVMLLHSD